MGGGCETNDEFDAKKTNNNLERQYTCWVSESVSGSRLQIIQGCQGQVPVMWFEAWGKVEVADTRNPIRRDETMADIPPLIFPFWGYR